MLPESMQHARYLRLPFVTREGRASQNTVSNRDVLGNARVSRAAFGVPAERIIYL